MPRPEQSPPTPLAHRLAWLLPGVTLGVLLTLLLAPGESGVGVAVVQAQQPPYAGGAGLYLAPARLGVDDQGRPAFGCYVLDTDAQRIAVYQVAPDAPAGNATFRLLAVRETAADRALRDFNSGSPTPSEMRDLLELQEAGERVRQARPTQ